VDAPNSTLLAAVRWLKELQHRDAPQARQVLKTAPAYRDLTPTQYQSGLEWLKDRGLVTEVGEIGETLSRPGVIVLRAAVDQSNPAWLPDADSLITSPVDLPLDILELGELLGVDEGAIFIEVERAWRKFDDVAQRELGAAGEAAMIGWLEENTAAKVVHVSAFDDGAGYDIALAVGGEHVARIEVKATRRVDSVVLYLSRNEFKMMRRYPSWCLQVVVLDQAGGLRSMGWLPTSSIEEWAPQDRSIGIWQSMRLTLPSTLLRPGPAPAIDALLAVKSVEKED